MHVPSTLSATFTFTQRFTPAQPAVTPAIPGANDGSAAIAPATLDAQSAPPVAPDSSNGDTLLSRLNVSRQHDGEKTRHGEESHESKKTHHNEKSEHGDKIDDKQIEKALKKTLKPMIKAIKHETKDLLNEIGANKEERQQVRALYKDFRHEIRDEIKLAKKSNLDDLNAVAPRIDKAFESFIAGLQEVFAPAGSSDTLAPVSPGIPETPGSPVLAPRGVSLTTTTPPNQPNVGPPLTFSGSSLVGAAADKVPTQPEQPTVTATPPIEPAVDPPSTLSSSTLVGAAADKVPTQTDQPTVTATPLSDIAPPPSRLDQFISSMKSILEQGLGSLTDKIASILTDAPERSLGHHRDDHDDDDDNSRRTRASEALSAYTFTASFSFSFQFDIAA